MRKLGIWKSVLHDGIAPVFPMIKFEEPFEYPDYLADIDYLGYVGSYAFGIQIKPVTARSNFGNYSPSERMKANFKAFEEEFGGKVFVIFSLDGEIANQEVIHEIELGIKRLSEKP